MILINWIKIVGIVVLGLTLSYLAVSLYYNHRAASNPEYQRFGAAEVPTDFPDGDYIGHAAGQGNWLGKSFDAKAQQGINRFSDGERYRFHMYFARSLTNSVQQVLRIDYNQAGNPLWLRFIVDELVQTGPNQFVGKIHVRIIPRAAFTIGYFSLQK